MSSTQRSRSAPSGDRGTFSESEDVQSSGLLTAERWRSTRERQPHHRDAFQGFSPEASNPTTQGITHVTNSTSSVAASEVAQGSELTAATNSSGASGVQSPWLRKTLLTLGT